MSRERELLRECLAFIKNWRETGSPIGYNDMSSDISAILSQPEAEPVVWVVPGDDNANVDGFIDAMAYKHGEFTRPLYAKEPAPQQKLEAEPSQHEASMAAVSRHKDGDVRRWYFSGQLCHYVDGVLTETIEHSAMSSAPSVPVVLYSDYEKLRDELRAELEALRKQLKPDDLSRWKDDWVDKHKGEYYYKCNVCGVSDWITNYGTYDQLKCKCNT